MKIQNLFSGLNKVCIGCVTPEWGGAEIDDSEA
jgi:hypothetical protein